MNQEILTVLTDIRDMMGGLTRTDDLWLPPKAALKNHGLPIGRDALYQELALALYCHDNNIPCDLTFGVHFVEASRQGTETGISSPRYKINVPLFKSVIVKPGESRLPARPLNEEFKKALSKLT